MIGICSSEMAKNLLQFPIICFYYSHYKWSRVNSGAFNAEGWEFDSQETILDFDYEASKSCFFFQHVFYPAPDLPFPLSVKLPEYHF